MNCRLLFFLSIFFTNICPAQKKDLCPYFTVQVSLPPGQDAKPYVSTEFNKGMNDALGEELKLHNDRYYYLLKKNCQYSSELTDLYPDAAKVSGRFCTLLATDKTFLKNFDLICPAKFLNHQPEKVSFSTQEMMFIASRFFYCNKVTKDTAIKPKICVGINGIKEMESGKDLLALESFVFEAIFFSLKNEKEPLFVNEFTQSIQKSMADRKKNLTSLDDFLLQVRNDCFKDMEQNETLKTALLAYYQANKHTINFTIQ